MICPICNASVKDGALTCPFCRATIQSPKYPWDAEADKKERESRKRTALLIALCGFLGAALLTVLVVVLVRPSFDNHPQNSAAQDRTDETEEVDAAVPAAEPFTVEIDSAFTLNGDVLGSSNVSGTRTFGPDCAIDGDVDTCWCVNTAQQGGVGAKIRFVLDGDHTVTGLRIVNGNQYLPAEDIYRSNGQIMDFTVQAGDRVYSFTASFNRGEPHRYEQFDFPEPVVTDHLVITVDSAYVGVKYGNNVCLTELEAFAVS